MTCYRLFPKVITKQTATDNHVEKTGTLRTAEKKNGHKESAENTEIDSVHTRTRNDSDAVIDIENTMSSSEQIQEDFRTNVINAHDIAENIIGTAYGSKTCVADAQFSPNELHTHHTVCIKNDGVWT